VLWIGLDGELEALHGLQQRLDTHLRQQGFAVDDRAFSPHITLARRREHAASGAPAWPPQHVDHPTFPLDALTLFQSRLSPRGPAYTPLFSAPLAA
jgi:2'-5' RNA ligase